MKSIAIIIQKLNGGGAERTAANLSILLSKFYEVHLIVFDGRNIAFPYNGVLHDLEIPPSKNKIKNFIKRVLKIRKIKKEFKIIATISLMDGANLANICTHVNDTIITSVRTYMSLARKDKMLVNYCMMKIIELKSDYIVALSKGVARDLNTNFGIKKDKIKVIYNPVNIEYFNNLSFSVLKCKSFKISTMGRLEMEKGQWHLIKAMKKVIKYYPNLKLEIYGEGTLKNELVEYCSRLGLNNNVIFKGFVKEPHRYLMQSELFVFPSLFEGLGNVLLEMMACGVPCIATDCFSGPREIMDNDSNIVFHLNHFALAKYGILISVPDDDFNLNNLHLTKEEQQMADAILFLLKNDRLKEYYCKKGLERATEFSYNNISNKWVELIEKGNVVI